MAQQTHVPKFSDWDNDNVPYTAFFENARKERAGGVKMNPNDPEENPEAFMGRKEGAESDAVFHAFQSPLHAPSNRSMSAEKHHIEGHMGRNVHRRSTSDQQKTGSHKRFISESSSDKSNLDYSLMQPKLHRAKSEQKKSVIEGSNYFSPSVPGFTRLRSRNHPSDDLSHRTASVPKFGDWDETDPTSGEGYTVIFNKVKQEKQIGAAKFPPMPPQPNFCSNNQKKRGNSSICSKICWRLCSNRNE